jgi:hypothetical protein
VDATGTLETLAGLLPSLPAESVEGLLVTFDTLVGVSDGAVHPVAAQLLRHAAESAQDVARRERLLGAAGAVAAGEHCAPTAGRLTAKQAAAVQTVTHAEWKERVARTPEPALPGDDVESEEEAEDWPYMEQEPPKLPHLRVRHFFRGLVVRVGRDFADAYGRAVCSGDLLTLLLPERTSDGYALSFMERTVRLSDSAAGHAGHAAIVGNAANAWFQPAPTARCLATLHEDVEKCRSWLSRSGERSPAPQLRSGPLAAKVFGRSSDLAAWIPVLFAGVTVLIPDS